MDVLEYLRVMMWIIAIATTIVAIGLGLILGYHWQRYSADPYVAKISISVYCIVSVLLALSMFGFIPA